MGLAACKICTLVWNEHSIAVFQPQADVKRTAAFCISLHDLRDLKVISNHAGTSVCKYNALPAADLFRLCFHPGNRFARMIILINFHIRSLIHRIISRTGDMVADLFHIIVPVCIQI